LPRERRNPVCGKSSLDYYGLIDQLRVGIVGGMGDIQTAIALAPKVVSL
jgi:hypothetical protein